MREQFIYAPPALLPDEGNHSGLATCHFCCTVSSLARRSTGVEGLLEGGVEGLFESGLCGRWPVFASGLGPALDVILGLEAALDVALGLGVALEVTHPLDGIRHGKAGGGSGDGDGGEKGCVRGGSGCQGGCGRGTEGGSHTGPRRWLRAAAVAAAPDGCGCGGDCDCRRGEYPGDSSSPVSIACCIGLYSGGHSLGACAGAALGVDRCCCCDPLGPHSRGHAAAAAHSAAAAHPGYGEAWHADGGACVAPGRSHLSSLGRHGWRLTSTGGLVPTLPPQPPPQLLLPSSLRPSAAAGVVPTRRCKECMCVPVMPPPSPLSPPSPPL
eukprot:scaffold114260_cov51-Phaeocystis_antarctica.AAC.2